MRAENDSKSSGASPTYTLHTRRRHPLTKVRSRIFVIKLPVRPRRLRASRSWQFFARVQLRIASDLELLLALLSVLTSSPIWSLLSLQSPSAQAHALGGRKFWTSCAL